MFMSNKKRYIISLSIILGSLIVSAETTVVVSHFIAKKNEKQPEKIDKSFHYYKNKEV